MQENAGWVSDRPVKTVDEILGDRLLGGPSEWGSHRWNDLLRCPRYYYYRYVRRLVMDQRPGEALEFGTLIHEMLARRYHGQDPWRVLEWLDAAGYVGDPLDDATRAYSDYETYYGTWKKRDIEKDPYFNTKQSWIEIPLTAQKSKLIPGVKLTARMDMAYLKRNALVLIDHKTSKRMSGKLTGGFALDTQVLTLMTAAIRDKLFRHYRLLGIEINAIVRTKTVQLRRIRYSYDADLVARFEANWHRWVSFLKWAREHDWPMFTANCLGKFDWPCDYRDACLYNSTVGLVEVPKGVNI